jgi:hypothetical protein
MNEMKRCVMLGFIFAILIGIGLAENVKIGNVKAFQKALEKNGFTVQEGRIGYLDVIKLYELERLPSTYGNNPTTKYLTYFVPPAPGHKIPELYTKLLAALELDQNSSPYWNLGPDEAIVFVGRTPPECKYFSFDPNVMNRTYGYETRWLFATFGDTLNNLVIKTEGKPDGFARNPYNQITMVISTADKGINKRIQAAALSTGYSKDIINTLVFPSSILNMGVENESDTFTTLIRPALYKHKQAGEKYLNNTPAVILRVTPKKSTKLDPYSYPEQRVRGTGKTEFDLIDDLEELRIAILNKYNESNATELPTSIAVTEGSDVIQRGIDGFGPCYDSCYLWSADQTAYLPTSTFPKLSDYYDFLWDPPITLGTDTDEFIIVYGVNHVATGKATYSSFTLYGADIWNGVGAIDDSEFAGTAEEYLPGNPNAKYLYVYKVARNCNGAPHCYEVPYDVGAYGIDLGQLLYIGWRSYLEESTKTGPSCTEIVYDKAIKFDPKDLQRETTSNSQSASLVTGLPILTKNESKILERESTCVEGCREYCNSECGDDELCDVEACMEDCEEDENCWETDVDASATIDV